MDKSSLHDLIDQARAQHDATTKRENLVCSAVAYTLAALALSAIASWAFVA